jgi:hypothetical protein
MENWQFALYGAILAWILRSLDELNGHGRLWMEQLNYSKRAGIFCIVNALLKHCAQAALCSERRGCG